MCVEFIVRTLSYLYEGPIKLKSTLVETRKMVNYARTW